MEGRGPRWNAGASHLNEAFKKSFYCAFGLVSLLDQHRRFRKCYMNRRGTKTVCPVVWEDGGSDPASYRSHPMSCVFYPSS